MPREEEVKKLLATRSASLLRLGRIAQQLRHLSNLPKARGVPPGTLHYACNICGKGNAIDLCNLPRDERTCLGCGSTLRQRGLISALSRKLFDGMRAIIRPGGFLLLTVPCNAAGSTTEHFPDLHDYRIQELDGKRCLVNRKANGEVEHFENLVFHGGPGETLELRHFALNSLEHQLLEAGFTQVEILVEPDFEHGVYWNHAYSVPIIAS